MAGTVKITDSTFNAEVEKSDIPVLVDFWAEWCGPCKMVAPVLEELAGELSGKLKICKLNVDENSELPGKFGVMSIPTMVIFKDGQEKDRIIGYHTAEQLKETIAPYM